MDLLDLYSKKGSFTEEEVKFLKTKMCKSNWKISYGIYKMKSFKGRYIAFIIDSMPSSPRKSGVENQWDIICTRELTNIEYDEQIRNFGSGNRRFHVWYYKKIEQLIADDAKYHVETPKVFVDKCKELGYSGGVQAIIDFNNYDDE